MGNENKALDTLRRFMEESGVDEQFELRACQAVGMIEDGKRILRVWFNDGRIRDWDMSGLVAQGEGRYEKLRDDAVFCGCATVWDGAPGFDFVGWHRMGDGLDFDPYEVWVAGKDVTRKVLEEDRIEDLRYKAEHPDDGMSAAEDTPQYGK